MQKTEMESQDDNTGEGQLNNKYTVLDEDTSAATKIISKDGTDITAKINMSHLKDGSQSWDQLGIPEELKNNLIAKGFKSPSKIQFQVMSLINTLKNEGQMTDIVAQSQNGSGKTLSFLVPALSTCTKDHQAAGSKMNPQIVIIADTKELIYQIYKIIKLIKPDWLKVDYHTKDKNNIEDINIHVLVTTVDSYFFLLNKSLVQTTALKMLIIDEADKIIMNDSSKKNLTTVFSAVNKLPQKPVVGLFSATLPDKCIHQLDTLKRNYNKIIVENKQDLSLKNLFHYYVKCNRGQKLKFIDGFLKNENEGSVIMFVNNRKFADDFARSLNSLGHKTEILLGDMELSDRVLILDKFKSGVIKVLITTNLLSRGIDARKVSLVVNLDMPYTYKKESERDKDNRDKIDLETYLHRCGRTARFGDMGVALNIIEDDRGMEDMKVIENEYGIKMIELTLDNYEEILKKNKENQSYNKIKHEQLEENI